jgi:hypothetical protein
MLNMSCCTRFAVADSCTVLPVQVARGYRRVVSHAVLCSAMYMTKLARSPVGLCKPCLMLNCLVDWLVSITCRRPHPKHWGTELSSLITDCMAQEAIARPKASEVGSFQSCWKSG